MSAIVSTASRPALPARWFRAGLALLALILALGTAAAIPAAPAAAASGSSFEQCFPVFDPKTGLIIDWICVPIAVETHPCPSCPDFAIGFDHLVIPADPWYLEDLAGGLGLLGEAVHAPDPRTAARLRAEARDAFLSAAERLGGARISLAEVGFADFENQIIEPVPEPWLVSAGIDLAGGLTLAGEALVNPDPQPWIDAAMARFDAALHALAHQRAAG
jgi:hypothetical protein